MIYLTLIFIELEYLNYKNNRTEIGVYLLLKQ